MASRLSFHLRELLARSKPSQFQHNARQSRHVSSVFHREASARRTMLFSEEKAAQLEAVGRIEKIEVEVITKSGTEELVMNKSISTPYDCARHMNEHIMNSTVLALVNDKDPWDMHRPLEESCKLQMLTMLDKKPTLCNNVFWRSCSFLLGAVVSKAFQDNIAVTLHSFPPPHVASGSFVLDAAIDLASWNPSDVELRALSADMVKLSYEQLHFERLSVSLELAKKMFAENPYKLEHIDNIYSVHDEIVVYRVGDHVDISRGPMMNNTGLLGRCSVTSVHKIGDLFRFQGVALPKGIRINHFAYGILEDRARKLNGNLLPSQLQSDLFIPAVEESQPAQVNQN